MNSAVGTSETPRGSQDAEGSRTDGREPGTRRKKLAGYLKAANELRQTYQQSYMQSWGTKDGNADAFESVPGAYPDGASFARTGDEEMVVFPSYARRHVKHKPTAVPGTIQESGGIGRDVRDTAGTGDAEYWKQQWDQYEDDNAIVDVDVRGWLYTPHKGPMSRRNRIFIGLARQMVGIPAPVGRSPTATASHSREPSPHGFREKVQARAARHEDEIVAREAETILKKGEAEAEAAGQGIYSEPPAKDLDAASLYDEDGRTEWIKRDRQTSADSLSLRSVRSYMKDENDDPRITPLQKRASWNSPAQMSAAELAVANTNLMTRLQPFLTNPLANNPVSAFFYNDIASRQRTFETNAYGHFNLRAALDFIPTHVRILASEGLSITEEVIITESSGVSVISDIDDTIKHSAIGGGAREIFRNVFIRELGDLSIDGVKEWYQKLADMDVKFHYVSNSPWQLYPVLTSYFKMAGLPRGSVHLKAYTGMLQGIFEPVAERKKGTLERLMRDFPERRYLLIGDSGEADLEVYTDVVLEYPDRILGVFIRDVTTVVAKGFFDSSMGPLSGDRGHRAGRHNGFSHQNYSPSKVDSDEDDPEFKAALAASLKDLDNSKLSDTFAKYDMGENRPALPRRKTEPAPREEEDLIDLNWDDDKPLSVRSNTSTPDLLNPSRQPRPPRPAKPDSLSGSTLDKIMSPPTSPKPRPPRPRKPSTSVVINKNLKIDAPSSTKSAYISEEEDEPPMSQNPPRPAALLPHHSYRASARQKLSSAYSHVHTSSGNHNNTPGHKSKKSIDAEKPIAQTASSAESKKNGSLSEQFDGARRDTQDSEAAARPLLDRRQISSYSSAAAQYASSLYNSATSTTAGNLNGADSTNSTFNSGTAANNPVASKKEELWKRRWARSKAIMEEKGVMLRSWRVGSDVVEDAVWLIEQAKKEQEGHGRRGGVSGKKRTSVH